LILPFWNLPTAHPISNQPQTAEKPKSGATLKAFVTGAIIAGSALVGGLAVVLWNRKALSGLRQPPEPGKKPSAGADENEG
jgi:hypothetical protein